MSAPNPKAPLLRQSGVPLDGMPKPYAFMHQCFKEGCTKEGSFGFGVALLKNKAGRWACLAHRPELEEIVYGRSAKLYPDSGGDE